MDLGGYDHGIEVKQSEAISALETNFNSNGVTAWEAFGSLVTTFKSDYFVGFSGFTQGTITSRLLNTMYNLSDGLKDFDDNNGNIITNSSDKIRNAFNNFEDVFDLYGDVKSSYQNFYDRFTSDKLDTAKVRVTDEGNISLR